MDMIVALINFATAHAELLASLLSLIAAVVASGSVASGPRKNRRH